MIDFIKVKLLDKTRMEQQLIKQKESYILEGKYNYTIADKMYPLRSRRENLFINITEQGGTIENSLHKFFNQLVGEGIHNFNDFDFCDVLYALNVLEEETNYPLEQTIITNLEFGFNIELNKCPTQFLEHHVLMHNYKSPCYEPKNDKGKKIKKFTYTEYEVKIYNKSLQYDKVKEFKDRLIDRNILRIEVKYKSKKQLHKLGIYNLSDLKKPQNLQMLMQDFLRKYNDLLIIDSYNGNAEMSKKERQFITHCTHPNYWIELRNTKHFNTISNQKKKFQKLIRKYELDSWKKQLKKDILSKFNELMVLDCYDDTISLLNVA